MQTKNIFKTVALAMMMPAMLLTTACSSDDDLVNNENTATKGYALPVTINVSRQGDEGTTRTTYTYDEGTKKGTLAFSEGDKLFVSGNHYDADQFAGTLDYDAVSGKFSGTIYTESEYTGTIDDLMASARAVLLPADYGSYGFLSIDGSGSDATVDFDFTKTFALTKAAAVEQFSVEQTFSYSSGFALDPSNAIVSFTISGLTANKEVAVSFNISLGTISGNVTTNATGVATFAVGVSPGQDLKDCTLTVAGNNIALPTKTVEAGHIYNISRPVHGVFWNSTDISGIHTSWEGGSVEIGGITFACDGNVEFNGSGLYSMSGDISFTSSLGNIKKIEIKHSGLGSWYGAEGFDGWPSDYDAEGGTFTWEGTPVETVKLPENTGWGQIDGITSIVFTLEISI